MTANHPTISVVMPVYRCEEYLPTAIESILNQSYKDFELIIISDSPSIRIKNILDYYGQYDDRIRIYINVQRIGLIESLNNGCKMANGRYIARMDCDDISLPERFEKQINFLDSNPEIGVVGTFTELIDKNGKSISISELPITSKAITWAFLFSCKIAHPTVMIRRDVLEKVGFYKKDALYVEDYELWTRLSKLTELRNIPSILLKYRIWENISNENTSIKEINSVRITKLLIDDLLHTDVSERIVLNLTRLGIKAEFTSQEIEELYIIITILYKNFLNLYEVDYQEIKEISKDMSIKLLLLAFACRKCSLTKSFDILMKSLQINKTLLLEPCIRKKFREYIKELI